MAGNDIAIVRMCKVISVDDNMLGKRIKVKLSPEDDNVKDADIPYAFPLFPKMFHVVPKVGEAVFVITSVAGDGFSERWYLGPIISQEKKMEKDSFSGTARSLFRGSPIIPTGIDAVEKNNGAYFKDGDVGILGRGVGDIQIKDNDVRIRCGVKKKGMTGFKFNTKDPAYVKLQYYDDALQYTNPKTGKGEECNSVATITAQKINLLGTNSKDYFAVNDKDNLISDETMKEILTKAHQLPYGDVLVDFLKLMRKALLEHTHPFSMMEPIKIGTALADVDNYNIDKMLSDTVRIN